MTSSISADEFRSSAADPLDSLRSTVALSSLDWAGAGDTAWMYGIICGWDCEIAHRHDDVCGGQEAIEDLAQQHDWTPARVTRLRALRTRWLELCATYGSREIHDLAADWTAVAKLTTRHRELEADNIALLARLAFSESGGHR